MTEQIEQTKEITRYMKSIISFLDGNGLVVVDWDMIEEALLECRDFSVLVDIIKKPEPEL